MFREADVQFTSGDEEKKSRHEENGTGDTYKDIFHRYSLK